MGAAWTVVRAAARLCVVAGAGARVLGVGTAVGALVVAGATGGAWADVVSVGLAAAGAVGLDIAAGCDDPEFELQAVTSSAAAQAVTTAGM